MLHATQPYGEFIRSELKLSDLAECAAIAKRYKEDIQYKATWQNSREHKLFLELTTYTLLAHRLMRADLNVQRKFLAYLHGYRLTVLNDLSILNDRGRTALWRIFAKAYYFAKMPGWVYRNACYGNDQTSVWMRIQFISKRIFDASSRTKAIQYGPK